MQVRVASYNIYHGQGTDGRFDLPGLAKVIGNTGADIVGLQEVDKCTTRSSGVDQAAEIARHLGFHHVFGMHFPYKNGEYGIAILTRYPILRSECYALPTATGCEPRTLLSATIDLGCVEADIFNTHLEVRNRNIREKQCAQVAEIVQRSKRPAILMGDMNAQPREWDVEGRLSRFMWDTDAEGHSPTYPSGKPEKRIDYILCTNQWKAQANRAVECIDSVRSDHVLVLAKLQLQAMPA